MKMHTIQRITGLVAVALIASLVSACGVKSSPQRPSDAVYPRHYPRPLPPLEVKKQPPRSPLSGR